MLTLIMPIFVLIVFRLGGGSTMRHSSLLMRTPDMAFPVAAGYTLLLLTNLVYNNFGERCRRNSIFLCGSGEFSPDRAS